MREGYKGPSGKEKALFTHKIKIMYIVQQSFTSVHGRYYSRGQEVSWLLRQLMASVDKKRLVKRSIYVSAYEEDYRQELQERDGETYIMIRNNPEIFPKSAPIGEEWTPSEDFGSVPYKGMHSVGNEDISSPDDLIGIGADPFFEQRDIDSFAAKVSAEVRMDSVPIADWNNDLPQNQQDSTTTIQYEPSSNDSVDSGDSSTSDSSGGSSDSSGGEN